MNKTDTKNIDARNDSDTTTFKLSVIKSANPLLNFFKGSNEERSIVVYHDGRDIKTEVTDCHGLLHFKQLLQKMERNTAIVPGHLNEDNACPSNTKIDLIGPLDSLEENELITERVFFNFELNEPALICFNVDGKGRTPDVAWDELCKIDPSLKKVGHLVTRSNSGFLRPLGDEENIAVSDRFNIYCLVKDGGDIRRYSFAFRMRFGAKYPVWMEGDENKSCFTRQFIYPPAFNSNNIIFKSPIANGEDLVQEKSLFQLYPGEILDTKELADTDDFENQKCLENYLNTIESILDTLKAQHSFALDLREYFT